MIVLLQLVVSQYYCVCNLKSTSTTTQCYQLALSLLQYSQPVINTIF